VKQELNQKIGDKNILFFDMDGTLIDTNYANFLSYKRAIKHILRSIPKISYDPNKRFNREVLKSVIPDIVETGYEKIIQEKEQHYKDYLPETKPNKLVVDILLKYSKTNKCVLITNCRKDRTLMTLDYFDLTDKFSNIFYRQLNCDEAKINKYQNAISCLSISPKEVIVFENKQSEIADAIVAGVPDKNILKF
jgi:beta-phosphoglucomutase